VNAGREAPSLGLAAFAFAIYAAGACPTIYVGDSGELVAAVYLLGIPHPSGYPLYVLLGKLWTLLVPLGSIAYRMSLFSAFCAAATVGVLHRLCRSLGLHPLAAAFAALLFAFSPSFWGEANVQRAYALNALFTALATAAALSWHRSRRPSRLVLAFFCCGLGASNHTFMAVYGVALLGFVLVTDPGLLRRPRGLLGGAAAFAAGLLPYLYLPLRSRADPPLDWGNPETPSRLVAVLLRRDFWPRAWVEGPADLLPIAADFVRGLGHELLWAGAVAAALGTVVGWRRRSPVLLPLLVMTANLAAVALHGSRTDLFVWHRYFIPSYLAAAVLAGLGAQVVIERLPGLMRPMALFVPALALLIGWRDFDRSRYRIAEDFSRVLLSTLPPGAHLTASDDNILFVLIYLHWVEGARADVDLILEGVGGTDLPPLRFDPDKDPLFFTHHPNWNLPELEIVPVGLVFQTLRAGRPWPPPVVPRTELAGERDPRVPKDYLTRNLIGHFHYMLGVSFENRDWRRASREFRAAECAAPQNDVLFYNLGLIYRRNGLFEEALAAFGRSHAINPRHIAGRDRVRAAAEVAEVRVEVERLRAIEADIAAGIGGGPVGRLEMAEKLERRGEVLAARGHRLRDEASRAPHGDGEL
jgi:tetratricopeptide (TPR) repeat protein